MNRLLVLALTSAWFAACQCGQPAKPCTTEQDCDPGQVCVQNICRGGTGNGGGAGGGGGAGQGGGGGQTIFTGCDPVAADNASRDTDCDGISDAEEYSTTWPPNSKTDPCNADSDGDGVLDGVEAGKTSSVSAACTFTGDADPNSKTNPTLADTDGDGLSDGEEDADKNGRQDGSEPNPLQLDSDCDGYTDKEEVKDLAAGCATDPTKKDTDGDGLSDGTESGLQPPGAESGRCLYTGATFDADNAAHTGACNPDSDGDGIMDGAEDTDLNGRVDTGELDPNNASDGTGPAQQACATTNLKPITLHSSGFADVNVALIPEFTEVSKLTMGTEQGIIFYDSTNKVGGIVLSKAPAGGTGTTEEAFGRGKIAAAGTVSNALTQTFTSWDGFAGSVRATYDVGGGADLKTALNNIATSYLGGGTTGTLSGAAGVTGPFKVQAVYLHRATTRAAVLLAIIPAANFTGQSIFRIDDVGNGTALAQYGDYTGTQCEVFDATVNAKVDFLWVVDDSCSMASSQTAVANAGNLFGQKLQNAGLDWRAAGASTGYWNDSPFGYEGSARDWTNNVTTMTSWFSGGGAWGTNGNASEAGFAGMRTFIDRTGPTSVGTFRTDATAHFIFLTDTREQSSFTAATQATYLTGRFPGANRWQAHGILCPEGGSCGDSSETNPGKYHDLIRGSGGVIGSIQVFNPTNPTAAQTAAQQATIDAILAAAIGGTGRQLQRPPISATIKVAMASTRGTCNAADVPRDRSNGWDIDPATRRLVFYGNCIPSAAGVKVAVSYRYWNDFSPDPAGDPCGAMCTAPLVCDPGTKTCVCPTNCGGTCGQGLTCQMSTCTCEPEIG